MKLEHALSLVLIIFMFILPLSYADATVVSVPEPASNVPNFKPILLPDVVQIKTNPLNEASSGSIVYHFSDSNYITQVALDTKVQMNITGIINRVRVEQTFTNPSNEWVEGVYVFPLPEDSAVDQMTMHIGNRILEGQIKERRQAVKIYKKAKKEGKRASLIEQQRSNIFTSSVANIPPGESIMIAIEYQQTVLVDNEKFSIRFPMVIGDRYIPGKEIGTAHDSVSSVPNTHRVTDASSITPPSDSSINRPISMLINLQAGFVTEYVKSSYHGINIVEVDDLTKRIALADNIQADRDFELVWHPNQTSQPELIAFTQQEGDDQYLMFMATPSNSKDLKAVEVPREVIFIIDSSGSMSGSSMVQAKEALIQAIRRLKKTDRFNVIDFDDEFNPLFKAAMPAIRSNKLWGIKFAEHLDADGGTEPLEAIKFAFTSRSADVSDYLRQVIFLTDGQVGNEDEILRTVQEYIDKDRMFTIGIGSAPNSFLMTKLADYGKGTFTYIGAIKEIHYKMVELFKKLEFPVITNMNISFYPNIYAEQAYDIIPDLYAGETLSAVFKMKKLPSKLVITGNLLGENFIKEIIINDHKNRSKGVDKLWGRRKIERSMDKLRSLYSGDEKDLLQQKITQLALDYHLVSKFTSLVAVDITPVGPGLEHLVRKAVWKKAKAPGTATSAYLWMFIGALLLLLALILQRRRIRCQK